MTGPVLIFRRWFWPVVLLLVVGGGYWQVMQWRGGERLKDSGRWEPSANELEPMTPVDEREYREIELGSEVLLVEVADTPGKITTGLSYREEIGAEGMLFVLGSRGRPGFWMWGMRFPIDILWIDCRDGRGRRVADLEEGGKRVECVVVEVTEKVPVAENPVDVDQPRYWPRSKVTHVLEVPAGWTQSKGVGEGSLVIW